MSICPETLIFLGKFNVFGEIVIFSDVHSVPIPHIASVAGSSAQMLRPELGHQGIALAAEDVVVCTVCVMVGSGFIGTYTCWLHFDP